MTLAEAAKIIQVPFKQQMESKYLSYAMSVIVGRALPDVRDGLKPVQRRVLYAMYEAGNTADKPHRKSAKTVGDVLGRFHPHGDSAVYDTMVRLAQEWVMAVPLIDGQGNFGSVDGDPAAAMRYTEARLSKIAGELLRDIEKDTVDWEDNFDNSEKEPSVLPARFPNLLVNGSTGIAVGMATNMPPHNLGEAIDAVVMMLDDPLVSVPELMRVLKGPDFPTGGIILGTSGIQKAYETGRGSVTIRAKTQIETTGSGKSRIVVTELPYNVNKARLVESIAELVRDRKIEGISDLRDESSRDGMRIVIEVRRDANANVILNQLLKHTALQQNFSIQNLALVDGRPQTLTLPEILMHYIQHQIEVIVRRSKFDLERARARAHIVQGLIKALDIIDEVIATIRSAPTTEEARNRLQLDFGFSEVQAQHILDMQLRRLTALEREKLEDEHRELTARIADLTALIESDERQRAVLREELLEIKRKYPMPRRTRITAGEDEPLTVEDLVADEPVVVTISHEGYIKRVPASTYRSQRRGGRGINGAGTKGDDFIEHIFATTTHADMFFFTDQGRVFRLKCHEIPEATRQARGTYILNVLSLRPEEKVVTVFPVKNADSKKGYLFFATRKGFIKKTAITDFENVRAGGIIAIKLDEGDSLVGVRLTNGQREMILVSSKGNALRFHEDEVRPMGRDARGVKGIGLVGDDDYVVGMDVVDPAAHLLVVSMTGVGKRTPLSEYPNYKRGSKGVRTLRLDGEKHGKIVAIQTVYEANDLMMISTNGVLIRLPVSAVAQRGRDTKGVQLMNLDPGDTLAAAAQVYKEEGGEEE